MFWASPGSATLPSSRFQLRKFDVFIHLRFHEFQSFWWCVPDICEISVLGSDENFSSCIPSPDVWFTAAFLVHLWTWTDSRSKNRHRNGICFAFFKKRLGSCFMFFFFFVKHFSNITGRFSLVTAWRRTPQAAVAPSAALRFAPPVPQLQLAKQRCSGLQQGYQNPDQIRSKSHEICVECEMRDDARRIENTLLILMWCEYLGPCTRCNWEIWEKQASHSELGSICKKDSKRIWLRHRVIKLSIKLIMDLSIRQFGNTSEDSLKISKVLVHQPKGRLFARTVIYLSKYEHLTYPVIVSVILHISHHTSFCLVLLSERNTIPMNNNIDDHEDITHHSNATLPEKGAACCKASWCIWQKSKRATLALELLTQLMAAFHVMTSAAA